MVNRGGSGDLVESPEGEQSETQVGGGSIRQHPPIVDGGSRVDWYAANRKLQSPLKWMTDVWTSQTPRGGTGETNVPHATEVNSSSHVVVVPACPGSDYRWVAASHKALIVVEARGHACANTEVLGTEG